MDIFTLTLISGVCVAAASGLVGSFLILRRMALMSDALSHVALPGIALGVILHFAPIWGGLVFLFIGVTLIWLVENKTKLATESVTGVMFVTALAIGALMIPEQDLLEAFFGNVTKLTVLQIGLQTFVAAAIIAFILVYLKRLTLFAIAPDLSASLKISSFKMQFVLLALIALTIAIGISFVGVLLMSAIVIIPAAAARNIAKSFNGFLMTSVVIAVISLTTGLVIGEAYSLNPGVMTVLVSAGLFVVSLFWRI
jgi:ABC-type Mn2+/Zn2+ transport system permease subunit